MKKAVIGLSTAAMLTATSCALNEQTNELETTWLFWAILAFFIVAAIVGCIQNVKNEEEKKERAEKLKKVTKKFHVSAKVVGVNNRYQFIVDDVDKRIILVEATGYKKIVPFDKIMSVEMVEDNTMISSRSIGRTIGGALIGDLVAGRAGMIVGGLSGDTKQTKRVSKVEVIIKMRDFNDTALHIPCFDARLETNNTQKDIKPEDSIFGPMYKKGVADAIKITQLVDIIIDQIENPSVQPISATPTQPSENNLESADPSTSIADEIKKLADMKAQGLITDDEFITLTSKIIQEK